MQPVVLLILLSLILFFWYKISYTIIEIIITTILIGFFIKCFIDFSFVFLYYALPACDEGAQRHWGVRKTYQTFLYGFNEFDAHNSFVRKKNRFLTRYRRSLIILRHMLNLFTFIKYIDITLENFLPNYWYTFSVTFWVCLTWSFYISEKTRDLGPSYDIYDYNPEDDMGVYLTLGPFLLLSWSVWTFSANNSSIKFLLYMLHSFVLKFNSMLKWHNITVYSCIYMYEINFFGTIINTNIFIFYNYITLLERSDSIFYNYRMLLEIIIYHYKNLPSILELHEVIDVKSYVSPFNTLLVWFPWESFFTYITVLSILYGLTLLSIYNTENVYYIVLYLVFLVFLFASTLVLLDLDIFAGLLVLIESVVVLMLFFLIIYLTPNITFNTKINSWKLTTITIIFITLLSNISYMNFNEIFSAPFLNSTIVLEEFYNALHDLFISELTGIYISLYWTNSLLLLVIGVLLLIASIICVVLVSFFTKLRIFNYQTFFQFFDIAKSCSAFIFLRKQNLSKQGRGVASTRIFSKKKLESESFSEYKEKYNVYEKQQQL